jgi:uncharacterized lipoprotein YajG
MFKRLAVCCALLSAWILTGCAMGNKHTFNYAPTSLTDMGKGRVVLLFAVEDQRPYVVSGDEPPEFVGEQRNGYGMPFNVTTSDRRPFAAVVQETLERDLFANGFRVTALTTKAGDVAAAVREAKADRALKVVMHEFKSDTYSNINFDYDFEVFVYDAEGKQIATDRATGEEALPGSFVNPAKSAKEKVPGHFYEKVHNLVIGNPKVVSALTAR